jgi:hypothetical protein
MRGSRRAYDPHLAACHWRNAVLFAFGLGLGQYPSLRGLSSSGSMPRISGWPEPILAPLCALDAGDGDTRHLHVALLSSGVPYAWAHTTRTIIGSSRAAARVTPRLPPLFPLPPRALPALTSPGAPTAGNHMLRTTASVTFGDIALTRSGSRLAMTR